jgi:hypothetical protein
MPEHKRNHEVPRSLIANWRPVARRGEPVWVFEISKQRLYQSSSIGSSAFKFAIGPNQHGE